MRSNVYHDDVTDVVRIHRLAWWIIFRKTSVVTCLSMVVQYMLPMKTFSQYPCHEPSHRFWKPMLAVTNASELKTDLSTTDILGYYRPHYCFRFQHLTKQILISDFFFIQCWSPVTLVAVQQASPVSFHLIILKPYTAALCRSFPKLLLDSLQFWGLEFRNFIKHFLLYLLLLTSEDV